MSHVFKLLSVAGLGVLAGAITTAVMLPGPQDGDQISAREPLYWVAPMDPNYRRDKPGKSPMGMDLIPVYADDKPKFDAGVVSISPEIINNLGMTTATVESGRLSTRIATVGYIQYDEDRLVHVHPRVAGWVESLSVKAAGDPVIAGQPLYTLYSPTLVNAQEEYLLALDRGNPVLIDAAKDRLISLQVPSEAITQLERKRKVSRTITLTVPQSGVVDNLQVREGMYIEPGMQLLSIASLDPIWVIAEVFERQAGLVAVGDAVHMQLDYLPGQEWVGEVDYIYPSLNAKTRTAQVRILINNHDGILRPGMFAQLVIDTAPGDEALLVPRDAVIRTGQQARVVLALGEGRFKSVAVELGRVAGDVAEVRAGLQLGDEIVTSAQFLIDSESSKDSDFRRLGDSPDTGNLPNHNHGQTMDHSSMDHPVMDHSAMDHSSMDHSAMDHSAMDHSTMDHSSMDHSAHTAAQDAAAEQKSVSEEPPNNEHQHNHGGMNP